MTMMIDAGRLVISGQPCRFVLSPHIGGVIEAPTLVVVHETHCSMRRFASVEWLTAPRDKNRTSAHFVIERDGTITQLVSTDRVAWHAGQSTWAGRGNCNTFSIGIELVGPGPYLPKGRGKAVCEATGQTVDVAELGLEPADWPDHPKGRLWLAPTEAQMTACHGLIAAIKARYPSIEAVAGHYQISPRRKCDPSPLCDLDALADALDVKPVRKPGRPAKPRPADPAPAGPHPDDIRRWQSRLHDLGYPCGAVDGVPGQATEDAVTLFQRHNGLPVTGHLDAATVAKIESPDTPRRPVSEGRSSIDAKELRRRGSFTIWLADLWRRIAIMLGLGGIAGTADQTAGLGAAERVMGVLDQGRAVVEKGSTQAAWLLTPKGLAVAGVVVLAVIMLATARALTAERVAKARDGADLTT